MPKSPAQAAGVPLGHPGFANPSRWDDPALSALGREWQGHVDAGRIGVRSGLSFDQRVRMMRNEIALFGRVVTRELERF